MLWASPDLPRQNQFHFFLHSLFGHFNYSFYSFHLNEIHLKLLRHCSRKFTLSLVPWLHFSPPLINNASKCPSPCNCKLRCLYQCLWYTIWRILGCSTRCSHSAHLCPAPHLIHTPRWRQRIHNQKPIHGHPWKLWQWRLWVRLCLLWTHARYWEKSPPSTWASDIDNIGGNACHTQPNDCVARSHLVIVVSATSFIWFVQPHAFLEKEYHPHSLCSPHHQISTIQSPAMSHHIWNEQHKLFWNGKYVPPIIPIGYYPQHPPRIYWLMAYKLWCMSLPETTCLKPAPSYQFDLVQWIWASVLPQNTITRSDYFWTTISNWAAWTLSMMVSCPSHINRQVNNEIVE